MVLVGTITLVTDLAAPSRRGQALSNFSVAPYLGVGFGPLIGESLAHAVGYREAFFAAAALSSAAVGPALFLPVARPEPERDAEPVRDAEPWPGLEVIRRDGWRRRLPVPPINRAALGPGTVMGFGFVGAVAYSAFLPLYAREIGLDGVRFVFLIYAVVIIAVRTLGGGIPDRMGPFRAGTLATALTAAGLVTMASHATPALLYPGTVIFAVGVALQYPALLALTVNRVPDRERSAAVATFTMFFDLAQGLGGAVLGQIAVVGGVRWSFLGAAGSAIVALVVLWTWVRAAPVRPTERLVAVELDDNAAAAVTTDGGNMDDTTARGVTAVRPRASRAGEVAAVE
jgi:MFS family permease